MPDRSIQLSKNTLTKISARYLSALRAHLGARLPGNGDRAQGLGRTAVAGGLLAHDLAIMHEQALGAIASSPALAHTEGKVTIRAGFFLTQALSTTAAKVTPGHDR